MRVVVLIAAVIAGCSSRPAITNVVPAPEWEAVFTRTEGWTGADGAATVVLPGERVLWLFGDTFIGTVVDGRHAEGTVMVNNTIAVTGVGPEAVEAVSLFWGGTEGKPEAWAAPDSALGREVGDVDREWFWPASGGLIARGEDGKDRLVLFMTRISRRDQSDSVWNFQARGTTALTVHNPEAEIENWKRSQRELTTLADGGRILIWGTGAVLVPGETGQEALILGIDETNVMDKRLVMARAPAASIERFETWRFRTREGWSEREADAEPVADGLSSETSLHRMRVHGRDCLVVVYSEGMLGRGILARTCAFPDGAWSDAVRIYDCPEPLEDRRMMAYSAKAHPEISRRGELLISYSVNSTDFWDVVAHAEKYRPRFVRIPAGILARAP